MSRTSPSAHARRLFVLAALLFFCARAADAAPQTFVSAKGDDANMCEHAAPCRTFAGALVRSHVGGEIVVLDSGEYGHVYTFGNNRVFGNTQETSGKASLVAQQFQRADDEDDSTAGGGEQVARR